jgi:predicted glycosyltransferase
MRKAKIWIDLDNTPHVPFFEPIMEELTARGFPLMVTARDAFQVCELADKKGISYTKVGRHHGKNRALKAAGLIFRALQLFPVELREKPVLAVSHGARSQILLSNLLRIPTILIADYEHSQFPRMMRPTWIMAPDMIPDESLCLKNGHIRKYSGIKEDVYVWKLVPDPSLLGELGLSDSDVIVTVRPPATEAHYHRPESVMLFEYFMNRASQTAAVKIVLLPRNRKQSELVRRNWPAWFEGGKTVIPPFAVDGLNLLWHSDLVVSGGGTMNREAAALGVPVYSIFRGTIGAVDRHLSDQGRLVLIGSPGEVDTKIPIEKRSRKAIAETTSRRTLNQVVDKIQEIAESYSLSA